MTNYLIKIVPLFWAVISFLTIYNIAKEFSSKKNLSLLITLFIVSTTSFVNASIKMYAEMILLPFVLLGFYCLLQFMRTTHIQKKTDWFIMGIILLLFSTWYKNEGMLYLFTAVCGVSIFAFRDVRNILKHKPKKIIGILLAASAISTLPWLVTKSVYLLHSRDFAVETFSFFNNKNMGKITEAFLSNFYSNWYDAATACTLIFLMVLIFNFKGLFKNRQMYFTLFNFALIFGIFYLAFFASVLPIDWHLQAVRRILLIPQILFCLVFIQNDTNKIKNEKVYD